VGFFVRHRLQKRIVQRQRDDRSVALESGARKAGGSYFRGLERRRDLRKEAGGRSGHESNINRWKNLKNWGQWAGGRKEARGGGGKTGI